MTPGQPDPTQIALAAGKLGPGIMRAVIVFLVALAGMAAITVLLILAGCRPSSPPTSSRGEDSPVTIATNMVTDGVFYYRMMRPRTQIGPNLWEIELWERVGDPDHVYRMVWPAWTNTAGEHQPATFAGMER